MPVNTWRKLPNSVKYVSVYNSEYSFQNTDKFIVPLKHYFLGDNRDCSKDSRFLSSRLRSRK